MVAFDNTVLSLLLHPDAEIPNDPATNVHVDRAQDRMRYLVERLQESGTRILIPSPALAEFLTVASADYLTEINQSMWFEVGPFDQRAAIETAVALRRAMASQRGKRLGQPDAWQKIKFDRQIVGIAKVYEVTAIFTTDANLRVVAEECGLEVIHVADLPLPPESQPTLLDNLSASSSPSELLPPAKRSRDVEPQ